MEVDIQLSNTKKMPVSGKGLPDNGRYDSNKARLKILLLELNSSQNKIQHCNRQTVVEEIMAVLDFVSFTYVTQLYISNKTGFNYH
ncbi:hypothetical protein AQUCO_02300034v1 [Aquilegia coerulea]|uniref:Uncharacterized protein n=1 Tax=Aquilegia coerulea TaxID=218851 RepID=A0A2G5DBS4_AQUCA|nr:hypothetical protein AQUCO_02300034v1 [Aquilegia coerulea]